MSARRVRVRVSLLGLGLALAGGAPGLHAVHADDNTNAGNAASAPGSGEGEGPGSGEAPAPAAGDDAASAASQPGAPLLGNDPNSVASSAPLDLNFLNLPAYDVETPSGKPARVGDQLQLKITGAGAIPSPSGFRLAVPKGTDSGAILDQGLDIPALATESADSPGSTDSPASPAPTASPDAKAPIEVAGPDLKFLVTAAKPGQLAIPSLAILDGTGKAIARTNPFSLQVQSAIPTTDKKPQEAAPPRPPVGLSFPWIVIVVLAALGILLIAGIIYGLVRWSRRKRPPVVATAPTVAPRSEDEIALAALGELERQQLIQKGKLKQHYFQLSETLKNYLGARFRVDAAESTTREMMAMLEHTTLPPESLRELESVFAKLDFVKFTDHVPDPGEGAELLERARSLVLKTRKPPTAHSPILGPGVPGSTTASRPENPRAI